MKLRSLLAAMRVAEKCCIPARQFLEEITTFFQMSDRGLVIIDVGLLELKIDDLPCWRERTQQRLTIEQLLRSVPAIRARCATTLLLFG